MFRLLPIALGLLPIALGHFSVRASAAESGYRYVTFRDGSIIRLDLATTPPFEWDQSVPAAAASDIVEARFSLEPAGKRIRQIKEQLGNLASPRFAVRETASLHLSKFAPGFSDLLSEFKLASTDPEVRYRITAVMAKIQPGTPSESNFDSLVTRSGSRLTGDVGAWSATVDYRGHRLKLSRENIAEFSLEPPSFVEGHPAKSAVAAAGGSAFTELPSDEDALLPPDLVRIGFEEDPDGRPLKPGENISERFASAGFRMSTSVKGSFVSVNDFTVQGRSKGLSAATHSPLWEGILTVDFHAPGSPTVPASVYSAGFWIASVSRGGTALEAYGESGEKIGTVVTKKSGNDFLAFNSTVPIAQIKIVPNIPVDPNYTIDDLFFTRPMPRGIRPEDGWGVVQTDGGERFLARKFTPSADAFELSELSLGIESLRLDSGAVRAFAPPREKKPPRHVAELGPEDIHWVMLKNGSRLRATRAGFPEHRWVTHPGTPIPPGAISALWGEAESPLSPPLTQQTFLRGRDRAATPSPADPALWLSIEKPVLGETRIETPEAKIPRFSPYRTTKVIWFCYPLPPIPKTHGMLVLNSGERITLSPPETSVGSVTSSGLELTISDQTISVPLEKITSCQLPSL